MSSIRLWNLGSNAQTTQSIKNELANQLPLENLLIHASEKRALPTHVIKGTSVSDILRSTTRIYLEQDTCVIYVIDSQDPMAAQRRRQDGNSLINHVEEIVRESRFAERVFFAPAVQKLDSCLPSIRKSLEADSKTWQEERKDINPHFRDSFVNRTEDEVIREFDPALTEVRDEKRGEPKGETMELTDLFDFISPNAIRIKGTRSDIEFVVEEFLYGSNPRRIRRCHPHLTPLQIYGSITYYLLNQEKMDAYIEAGRAAVTAVIEKYRRDRSASSSSGDNSQLSKSSARGGETAVIRESAPEMTGVGAEASAEPKTKSLHIRDMFEFISPEAIRIKGTRIGIEHVIEEFVDGSSPEEIRQRFSHLTPTQIYSSITYYLLNREKMDAYIEAGHQAEEAMFQKQRENPSPGIARLMKISEEARAARLKLRELSE